MNNINDFKQKYEKAIEGLNDNDLSFIASLSKDQLAEWVESPPEIRPFKLRNWVGERPLEEQFEYDIVDGFKRITSPTMRYILFASFIFVCVFCVCAFVWFLFF